MSDLHSAVARFAGTDAIDPAADAVIWDARQKASLERAAAYLSEADAAIAAGSTMVRIGTAIFGARDYTKK